MRSQILRVSGVGVILIAGDLMDRGEGQNTILGISTSKMEQRENSASRCTLI